MGSIASYEAMMRAAANANSDAARAYFPVLSEAKTVKPLVLTPNERILVEISQSVQNSIRRSPLAIKIPSRASHASHSDILSVQRFFRTASTKRVQEEPTTSIWSTDNTWVSPDSVPAELRPHTMRSAATVRPKKRLRVDHSHSQVANLKDALLATHDDTNVDGTDQQLQNDDAEDGEQDDANAADGVAAEEDDDLELDADYQTGVRFDDDDGYEEADSGAEEATF